MSIYGAISGVDGATKGNQFATHCQGDGMALYRMSDEFFEMLASDNTVDELKDLVHMEWERAVAASEVRLSYHFADALVM